jgi:UDP-glucose 4-epimerase
VYGPRQSANPYSGVIAIFSKQLRQGDRPTIYGDGTQTRDFIHVSDVVKANLLALRTNNGVGGAFNVGTGHPTSINELASLLSNLEGRPDISPKHCAARAGDIHDSYANITNAKRALGFESKVSLEEGLSSLLDWKRRTRR